MSSKGNVKVSYAICTCYCHDHPLYCEQTKTSSSEGDCSELVGDSDSEGFGIRVVSSGLYNVLKCLYICVTTLCECMHMCKVCLHISDL